jgi:N-acetylglucosamine-6-phosphate deacetylase
MAVSDNLSHAGLSGADFHAGGKRLHRDGAVARDARGGLAGTLDSLPKILAARVAEGALTWAQAIRMGAEVPGRLFGDCGRFEPGLRADLVALNSEGGVDQVWVGGRRAAN